MNNNYFKVDNKTLATALNYCGFSYMKFDGDSGNTIYSFRDSCELRDALKQLNTIRKKNNSFK